MINSNSIHNILENAVKFLRQNKHEEAISCFDEVLEIDPNCSMEFRNKGTLLINLEKYEEAIAYLDKALEMDPNDSELLSRKGFALGMLSKYDNALNYTNQALEIDPNCSMAFCNKGTLLINLEKYDEAIAYLDKALEVDPKNVELLFGKGYALEMIGRNDEAISYLLKALEINPDNQEILDSLKFHFVNYSNAITLSNRILKINSENPLSMSIKDVPLNEVNTDLISLNKGENKEIFFASDIIHLYKKYLKREPDLKGLIFWNQQLVEGKSLDWVKEQFKNQNKEFPS